MAFCLKLFTASYTNSKKKPIPFLFLKKLNQSVLHLTILYDVQCRNGWIIFLGHRFINIENNDKCRGMVDNYAIWILLWD